MISRVLFRRTQLLLICIIIVAFLLISSPLPKVYGASITVNNTCSLVDAIIAANTDSASGGCSAGTAGLDTITITQSGTVNGLILISFQLTVQGTSSQPSVIQIEGNGYTVSGIEVYRVFLVQGHGDLRINDLVITAGRGTNGGAIKVDQFGILTLNNVTVKDSVSTAGPGGGIRVDDGNLVMTNSTIDNNRSYGDGGGMHLTGVVTITNSVIRDNRADHHSDDEDGGGIYVEGTDSIVTIEKSSIYGNIAGSTGTGGGVYVDDASNFTLRNSTIFNNDGGFRGGGIYVGGGTVDLTHVTVVDNQASQSLSGGGLRRGNGTVRLRNSIIAGSTSDGVTAIGDCAGTLNQNRNNLIEDGSCSAAYSGDPRLASNPQGSPPYFRLLSDSPAIGVGHAEHCAGVETDQRGLPRPSSGCDLGAYEYISAPQPTAAPRSTQSPGNGGGNGSSRSASSADATPVATRGPSTGELLVAQGYGLSATYGLKSGVQFQRVNQSGIGIQSVLDMGFLDAIDVWGWVNQGVEVCFPQQGEIVFLDASTSPRTVRTIDFTYADGFTCAYLTGPGTLVLVSSGSASASSSEETTTLSGCVITTTAMVNMRNAPGGDQILLVFFPDTVFTALQRTTDWFKVDYQGTPGWISALYVVASGTCD